MKCGTEIKLRREAQSREVQSTETTAARDRSARMRPAKTNCGQRPTLEKCGNIAQTSNLEARGPERAQATSVRKVRPTHTHNNGHSLCPSRTDNCGGNAQVGRHGSGVHGQGGVVTVVVSTVVTSISLSRSVKVVCWQLCQRGCRWVVVFASEVVVVLVVVWSVGSPAYWS